MSEAAFAAGDKCWMFSEVLQFLVSVQILLPQHVSESVLRIVGTLTLGRLSLTDVYLGRKIFHQGFITQGHMQATL